MQQLPEEVRSFIEYVPSTYAVFDRQMRYLAVSPQFRDEYRLAGRFGGPEELIGLSHYEVFPEIPDHWKDVHARCLAGATERCAREPFLRSDGSTDWVSWEIRPWRRSDGAIGGIILYSDVITDRVEAELALRESGARYRLLLEGASDGFHILDAQGNLVEASPSFYAMHGHPQGTKPNIAEWNAEWTGSDLARRLRELVAVPATFETRHRRWDGSIIDVEISAQNMVLGGRALLCCSVRDITERKQYEAMLKESEQQYRQMAAEAARANAAKSQFLARVSHELRTPLNAIIGFAQLLQTMRDPLTSQQRHFVQIIEKGGNHLLKVINDILDLTKVEAGRTAISLGVVAIAPLIEKVCSLLDPMAHAAGIELSVGPFPSARRDVVADEARLAQILMNLGSNAIKYNRRGGTVRIEVSEAAGGIRLSVIDTGRGIRPERQKDVFQPFNRLGAERDGVDGTGIGLSISKGLVELMGGRIGFESELGEGSTFWVDMPAAPPGQRVRTMS
jgi:PAS domain S-box-containing protein